MIDTIFQNWIGLVGSSFIYLTLTWIFLHALFAVLFDSFQI